MADIQPKNTDTIRINKIKEKTAASNITLDNITLVDSLLEKTASNGVRLNSIVKFTTALIPLSSTIDLGTSTAAEHIRVAYAKAVASVGTDLAFKTNTAGAELTRMSLLQTGELSQDATNGSNLLWGNKQSTIVTVGPCTTGLTAAGTVITDALDLTAFFNNVITVAAATGVQLWDAPVNSMVMVRNAGANALLVYPHSAAGTLNGGGAGTSVSVATGTLNMFWRVSSTNWIAIEFAVANA